MQSMPILSRWYFSRLSLLDRRDVRSCDYYASKAFLNLLYASKAKLTSSLFKVLGHKEGLNVMEKADPLIMLIGLPTIPVCLMLGRLIRWEDAVLKFWRKHSTKFGDLPLLNLIFPNSKLLFQSYLEKRSFNFGF